MPNETAMGVRPVNATDAEGIACLSGQLGYPVDVSEVIDRLGQAGLDGSQQVFVAFCGDEVVGWIEVQTRATIESGSYGEIVGLIVAEGHRGEGIGTRLVSEAVRWTGGRNVLGLRVRTNTVREDAVRFYLKHGFVQTKTQYVLDRSPGDS